MALLQAILAGERDPQRLAQLRNPHCHHAEDDIAKALPGTWRAEHLCALRQAVALAPCSHQQIAPCEQQSTQPLATFADTSAGQPFPPKARRPTKTNAPRFAARTPLSRMAGVDVTTIEGIEAHTAFILRSAIGTDMPRWPSVQHCCSWLGLCPQHQISGARCCRGGDAPERIVSRSPCAAPLAVCTTRRGPWGPALGGCKRASAPQRPSRRRRISWRVGSLACGHTAARTSTRASMPLKRRIVHGRSRRWPSRPRHWGRPWCPSQRRDTTASPGRSGRGRPPVAPLMP
jgi:hypothetical protein